MIHVLELGPRDASATAAAEARLRDTPGLGAVVVTDDGRPVTVVTYEHLAQRAPGGLDELLKLLLTRSYAVVDQDGRPWDPPARTGNPLRTVARKTLNVGRVPPRQRAAQTRRRWRRRRFLARLRREAWLSGTDLHVDVSQDLFVEPGLRFQMAPGRASLTIGPRCRLLSGSLLRLRGDLLIGPGCEIRQDVSLNVKGRLELQGRNVLGKGAMLHADGPMVLEWGACVAEYVTVLDTHHDLDGSLVQMLDQPVELRPVTLGAASFVGAKASVMPGVTVGRASIVGAGSVVTRDVADGWVVAGSPAVPIRQLVDG